MALPLQPDLHPAPPWRRRLLITILLLTGLVVADLLVATRSHPIRLLQTDARSPDPYLARVHRLIDRAQHRVWVMLYVVRPDGTDGVVTGLLDALGRAHQRGVDVRVVLDLGRRWGETVIEPKHEEAAAHLASWGVPVVLDEVDRTSHSKIVLVDDRWAVVGSHNWTRSALTLNRETSLLVDDPLVVMQLAMDFDALPGFTAAAGPGRLAGPGEPASSTP